MTEIFAHQDSESHASSAMASAMGSESQDTELDSILRILAEHCNAEFGLLLQFTDGDHRGQVLTCWQALQEGKSAIHEQVAIAVANHDALRNGTRGLHHQALTVEGLRMQLSSLHFTPAIGVEIIAVCGRPHDAMSVPDQVFRRLRPVIEFYLRLWWLHGKERRRANAFRQALEITDLGVVLLNRRAGMLFANRSAQRLMREADGLQVQGTSLGCPLPEETQRLRAALQYTILSTNVPSAGERINWPARMIALRRKGRRSLILSVLGIERPAVDNDDPAVIIYVLDPEHDVRKMLAPAYRLYHLTAVESRLASELVSGASLAEAASAISVRLHTARGYLKQVFAKTDTNRQADLIRLMLASAARSSMSTDLSFL